MNKTREKLVALGAEKLADILLQTAAQISSVDDLIDHLVATPVENTGRFKTKLSRLSRKRGFVDWNKAYDFSLELELMLEDLKAGTDDPVKGVELVKAFFESDSDILEMCDDSSGCIGMVFRHHAKELFLWYAKKYPDKERLSQLVLELCSIDDYGVRRSLLDCAHEYLPEKNLHDMVEVLRGKAKKTTDTYKKSHFLSKAKLLASQVGDPELFEQIALDGSDEFSSHTALEISRVYLANDCVDKAYYWIKQIEIEENSYGLYEYEEVLEAIYRKQGDNVKLAELLLKKLRAMPTIEKLQNLLEVVGEDKHAEIVCREIDLFLTESRLSLDRAEFMVDVGHIDNAERYLLKHAQKIDGNSYDSLLPLAATMEREKRYLAATLIYRALLLSILERGFTKAYHHGVDYLRKLDLLSELVSDWHSHESHNEFKALLKQDHGRKYSFWQRYE